MTLYTTEPCGFCTAAKALLRERGIDYEEINLVRDAAARESLIKLTGQMTFPQVLIEERPIGGFRELLVLDRDGSLEKLLSPQA